MGRPQQRKANVNSKEPATELHSHVRSWKGGGMRNILFIALLTTLFLNSAKVLAADWKFYGSSDLSKRETVIGYYDAASIERLSASHVRAWTKTISLSEVERIMKVEEVSKKAHRKIEAEYVPPYILLNPKPEPGFDARMRIIVWEEAANYDVIKSKTKTFYELNCKRNKIRTLSSASSENDGRPKTRPKIDKWISISLESNAETLHNILCRQRDLIK